MELTVLRLNQGYGCRPRVWVRLVVVDWSWSLHLFYDRLIDRHKVKEGSPSNALGERSF